MAFRVAAALAFLLAIQPAIFQEIPSSAGVDFHHENSPTAAKYLPETMGGGVALFDYDNDGDLDIFVTNGGRIDDPMPPGKKVDKSDRKYWNRLYRNDGNWKFTDVTEKAGLTGVGTGYGMGVAVGDFDNDGFQDLYLTTYGGNVLYRNRGDGTVEKVKVEEGGAGHRWRSSAGVFDYNNHRQPDPVVCRHF